ncbi:hypothetical protein R6Q59_023683 [Mikania micrantha]
MLQITGKVVSTFGFKINMNSAFLNFNKSYPHPSFKVDNGCMSNLISTLYDDDWNVLVAHFIGMDFAGQIYGVDSIQMINKLKQHNEELE